MAYLRSSDSNMITPLGKKAKAVRLSGPMSYQEGPVGPMSPRRPTKKYLEALGKWKRLYQPKKV